MEWDGGVGSEMGVCGEMGWDGGVGSEMGVCGEMKLRNGIYSGCVKLSKYLFSLLKPGKEMAVSGEGYSELAVLPHRPPLDPAPVVTSY